MGTAWKLVFKEHHGTGMRLNFTQHAAIFVFSFFNFSFRQEK